MPNISQNDELLRVQDENCDIVFNYDERENGGVAVHAEKDGQNQKVSPEYARAALVKQIGSGGDMSEYEKIENRVNSINYNYNFPRSSLNKVYPSVGALWDHIGSADHSKYVELFRGTVNLEKPWSESPYVTCDIPKLRHYFGVNHYSISVNWLDSSDYLQDDTTSYSQHESYFMIGNGNLEWSDIRDTGEIFCLSFYGDHGEYGNVDPDRGAYLTLNKSLPGRAEVCIWVTYASYRAPDLKYNGVYNLYLPTEAIDYNVSNDTRYLDSISDSFQKEVNGLFDMLEEIWPNGEVRLHDLFGRTWQCTYCTDGRDWDDDNPGYGEYISGVHVKFDIKETYVNGRYRVSSVEETKYLIHITRDKFSVAVVENTTSLV